MEMNKNVDITKKCPDLQAVVPKKSCTAICTLIALGGSPVCSHLQAVVPKKVCTAICALIGLCGSPGLKHSMRQVINC